MRAFMKLIPFYILIILLFLTLPVLSEVRNSSDWIEKGKTALQGGQYNESISFFDQAIEEGKDLNTAYNNKGVAELRLGMCNESISSFQNALQQDHLNPDTYLNLALAQKCSGDRTGAYNSINQGLNSTPNQSLLLVVRGIMEGEDGAYQKGLDSINQSISLYSKNPVAFYEKSNVMFTLNDFSGAYSAIQEAVNISPDDQTYLFNRGVIEERLQMYRNALETYNRVLALNSSHIKALYNKGSILYDHNRFNESLEAFTKVTELEPAFSDAWYFRGISQKNLGQINASAESFREASALDPNNREYRAYADHYESLPSKQQKRPIPFSPITSVIAILLGICFIMMRRTL